MFQINDFVNYRSKGICKIEDISYFKFNAERGERRYYVLRPVYDPGTVIYVPADNEELLKRMHSVLSQSEIDAIILDSQNADIHWVKDHRQRAEQFRGILNRRDECELLRMVRCLYLKSKQSGLTATDAQYLKKAEEIIEQEFSFSLKANAKDVNTYIRSKLGD